MVVFVVPSEVSQRQLVKDCDWCGVSVGQADSAVKAGGPYCGLA